MASALLQSRKTDIVHRLVLSVKSKKSQVQLQNQFATYHKQVKVLRGQNVEAAQEADTIILAHMPYMVKDILSEKGMREAFKKKLVISILAGINAKKIQGALGIPDGQQEYDLIRAMPNLATSLRESMTVVKEPGPDASPESLEKATRILKQFGSTVTVPDETYHAAGILTGDGRNGGCCFGCRHDSTSSQRGGHPVPQGMGQALGTGQDTNRHPRVFGSTRGGKLSGNCDSR